MRSRRHASPQVMSDVVDGPETVANLHSAGAAPGAVIQVPQTAPRGVHLHLARVSPRFALVLEAPGAAARAVPRS